MTDRVFLITGASSGIGAATARLAAAQGYRVVLAARRAERLSELAAQLGGGRRALPLPCDVTDWAQVDALVERALDAYGRIDVAFANAGIWFQTSFDPARTRGAAAAIATPAGPGTPEEWRDMVLANVYGPAITARATLPALVESRGHLLITGSVAGRVPTPGSLYSATKWAVTALGQNIRAELAGSGVRVTVVQPGLVDTEIVDPGRQAHAKLSPDDVARAVLYAVSQPSTVDVNEIVVRPTGQVWHR